MSIFYRFAKYWLPVVVLCIAIFVQSAFPSPDALPSFAFSDKLLHVVVYGLMAVLFCRALNSHASWRRRWLRIFIMGVAAVTLYGLSDEWHQSFVAGRSAEAADLLADFAGSIAGSGGYLWYGQQRHPD